MCPSVFICVLGGKQASTLQVVVMKFKCVCPVLKWGGAWYVLCKVTWFLFLFICVTDLSCQIPVSCWGEPSETPWPCVSPPLFQAQSRVQACPVSKGPGQPHGCVPLKDTGDCVLDWPPGHTPSPFLSRKDETGNAFHLSSDCLRRRSVGTAVRRRVKRDMTPSAGSCLMHRDHQPG